MLSYIMGKGSCNTQQYILEGAEKIFLKSAKTKQHVPKLHLNSTWNRFNYHSAKSQLLTASDIEHKYLLSTVNKYNSIFRGPYIIYNILDHERPHMNLLTNLNILPEICPLWTWRTALLWTALWRSTHFVYGCTVITTSALSPYETHASSQNSLSSSQSHALLMTRPERDTETHTAFPSVTAGCLRERVCVIARMCMWLNRWAGFLQWLAV